MSSTFYGLEIGRRALATNQLALDVVGQNVSNVNTPGYSRQTVNIETTDPFTPPDLQHGNPGQLGTGVTVGSVTRMRDAFVDQQLRGANSNQGSLNNLRDVLGQVENAFNEPSDNGLGQLMTNFFNSFSDLASDPSSGAIRSTVQNRGQALVSAFHSVSTALSQITPDIQSNVTTQVNSANDIAKQIASLNKSIRSAIASNDHPNDLQDKRDNLLNQLSQITDVQVVAVRDPQTNLVTGEVNVNVGGFALVQGDTANALPTQLTTSNGTLGLQTPDKVTIPLHSGQLYGLAKATTLVAGYKSDLDTLASKLITTVNTQHQAGVGLDGQGARDFFSGSNATDISLSSAVTSNLNAIAAASKPVAPGTFASGNGDNARALAAISATQVINGFSLNGYYNANVAQVGSDSQTFQTEANTQQSVVTQLQNHQQSVSGVNMDEELTHMLQFQRSYQAAARIVNVMDDTLDRIINGLGAGK